jgi:hypothetical protein
MKFLFYILLSYLAYRYFVRPLFEGDASRKPIQNHFNININTKNPEAPKDKGDYVDYEEVK